VLEKPGRRLLAAGQNVTSIEGAPPTKRVAIQVWDSMEKDPGLAQFGRVQEGPRDRRQAREIPRLHG
jgi:hypothetical protein